jgi:hypothetical protein
MHKSFSESFYEILTPCNIDSANKPPSNVPRTVSGTSKTVAVKHAKKIARKAMQAAQVEAADDEDVRTLLSGLIEDDHE